MMYLYLYLAVLVIFETFCTAALFVEVASIGSSKTILNNDSAKQARHEVIRLLIYMFLIIPLWPLSLPLFLIGIFLLISTFGAYNFYIGCKKILSV